jgi:anti-sigma B factor antagonist
MPLAIQFQPNPDPLKAGALYVKLAGSLDTATSPELEQRLTPVLAGAVKEMVFDLAELKFVSSAGLRVFAVAGKKLAERGGRASFVKLQPQIKEVFEIVASLRGMSVFESEAELDAYLAARQETYNKQR